jgi:hypothetical protein
MKRRSLQSADKSTNIEASEIKLPVWHDYSAFELGFTVLTQAMIFHNISKNVTESFAAISGKC